MIAFVLPGVKKYLTSFFPIWIPLFLYLLWLLWLGLPILYWLEVLRVGILVFSWIQREGFHHGVLCWLGFAINGFYYVEICSFYTHSDGSFFFFLILNGYGLLSKAMSASIEMIMWFLSFLLLVCCVMLIDLYLLNYFCNSGLNPTWSWCMILFTYCRIWFANILLKTFTSIFIKDTGL